MNTGPKELVRDRIRPGQADKAGDQPWRGGAAPDGLRVLVRSFPAVGRESGAARVSLFAHPFRCAAGTAARPFCPLALARRPDADRCPFGLR